MQAPCLMMEEEKKNQFKCNIIHTQIYIGIGICHTERSPITDMQVSTLVPPESYKWKVKNNNNNKADMAGKSQRSALDNIIGDMKQSVRRLLSAKNIQRPRNAPEHFKCWIVSKHHHHHLLLIPIFATVVSAWLRHVVHLTPACVHWYHRVEQQK